MNHQNKSNSRRKFIKTGLVAASSLLVAPRHVLGAGFIAPSDKLNIAAIGAGGKGFTDIENAFNQGQSNVVALCDVDKNHCAKAIAKFPKAKFYADFRVMLEEMKDTIDAVTISTPDHIHGIAAMTAMQLGIHVYVQKPLAHNIYEARRLTEAAEQYRIVSQMGNQGASNPAQQQMIDWFQEGLIGSVNEVHVWTDRPVWPQGIPVPKGKKAMPKGMSKANWDLFIGPANYVNYDPLYHPFKWRGWWEFGSGALGDMGCHLIDIPFRILELNYPTEVECSVGQVFKRDWVPEYIPEGCPPSSRVQLTFPKSIKNSNRKDIVMTWSDGGIRPFHPQLIPAQDYLGSPGSGNGVMMIGEKGIISCGGSGGNYPKLYLNGGEVRTMPKEYKTSNRNESMVEFGHQVSWCDAIKAGYGSEKHKSLTSSFDYSGPLTETVIMGNLAIRSYMLKTKKVNSKKETTYAFEGRKKLLWDGANMKITNYDEANQFVSRNYREGWKLI